MSSFLVAHEREKLINALIYFSENVQHPGKTKLFKLLNFLDFLHYEKTGRSVTGLKYFAWKRGPVPQELFEELKHPKPDLTKHLARRSEKLGNGNTRQRFVPRVKFDDSWFSPFELELMEMLAKEHFRHSADEMSEKSHFETGPWDEVWSVNGNKNAEIPYELVLLRRGNEEDQEIIETAKEYLEIQKNYG